MRPLVVLSGQGLARADGFNLIRRLRMTAWIRAAADRLPRPQRSCLDSLLREIARDDAALTRVVQQIQHVAREERRTLSRKRVHRGVLDHLARLARTRPVLHLTTNVDSLTTAVATVYHGSSWPSHGATSSCDVLADAVSMTIQRRSGLMHFPLHGEASLLSCGRQHSGFRHQYGDSEGASRSDGWIPSLKLGAALGLGNIEERLPTTHLAMTTARALLDKPTSAEAASCCESGDLVTLGYGASERAGRAANPAERLIDGACAHRPKGAGRRIALLHISAPALVRDWYLQRSFTVEPYDADLLTRFAAVLASLDTSEPI